MRILFLIFCAIALAACTSSDEQRTKDQARQTADEVKKDAKVVLHKAEVGAQKAGKEINEDLDKARKKVRDAVKN